MTNITLYQAAADKQNAIMLCVDEDGVLDTEKLSQIEGTFEQKAVAYIAVKKTLDHTINSLNAQLDAVEAEYTRRINQLAKNAERIQQSLYEAMKATGTSKVQSDDGLLSAALHIDRDVSIEIDEGAVIPPEFCNDPRPPAPSKTKLKAAIEAGQPVPAGVRILRKDRLTIR